VHLATIGPFKIEREPDRGGVGDVYLARDTRLVACGTMQASFLRGLLSIARSPSVSFRLQFMHRVP